ncbi:MAG: hypothetical protein A2Y94_00035 [Caldithrix sp. RBG_13_44_9]|nr:MAG: hypothetical protein A2Y94_00035 [Caldithrix sp. RBG_13_44_9]
MKTFKVVLTRTYIISIKAESKERAKSFSEFYLGNCPDLSTQKDRSDKNFAIDDIELVINNAMEII